MLLFFKKKLRLLTTVTWDCCDSRDVIVTQENNTRLVSSFSPDFNAFSTSTSIKLNLTRFQRFSPTYLPENYINVSILYSAIKYKLDYFGSIMCVLLNVIVIYLGLPGSPTHTCTHPAAKLKVCKPDLMATIIIHVIFSFFLKLAQSYNTLQK